MQDKNKPHRHGGKCKKAPYETQMVRCPVPIKEQIQRVIKTWHENNYSHQFKHENAGATIELIFEYANEKQINWTSPRNDGLKKFLDWLEEKTKKSLLR